MKATREAALDAWEYGAISNKANGRTDGLTNDLLETIAGKRYMTDFNSDPDPIYTTIGNLTASERRRFIKGVIEIVKKYAPDAPSLEEYIEGEVEI